ncbi:class I SAM-dependent methyltransferase [Chloroflexota bacterium]
MDVDDQELKACCANFYQSDMVRMLLGDVLHPGGLELTHHLGEVLKLGPGDRVLDVACGRGSSAVHLSESFGCHVTGADYSPESLAQAESLAASRGVSHLTTFTPGDAESLPFGDADFDALISECSLCTFPNKKVAAQEMYRVLRRGARLGITDVTVNGPMPEDIQSVLAWVACIGGAGSSSDYVSLLSKAGFSDFVTEDRRDAGKTMVEEIRHKLTGLGLIAKLGKMDVGDLDLKGTSEVLQRVSGLIDEGLIGYVLIAARKT